MLESIKMLNLKTLLVHLVVLINTHFQSMILPMLVTRWHELILHRILKVLKEKFMLSFLNLKNIMRKKKKVKRKENNGSQRNV